MEVAASFSSPQPRVGYGPADPLGGLSSRREGVLYSLLHSLPLAASYQGLRVLIGTPRDFSLGANYYEVWEFGASRPVINLVVAENLLRIGLWV